MKISGTKTPSSTASTSIRDGVGDLPGLINRLDYLNSLGVDVIWLAPMGEDLSLEERAAVRTPMQWSAERNAGFSTARRLSNPVIAKGPYGYQSVNVDAQRRDPDSLLNWMIKMIRVRKECPEIGWGRWTSMTTEVREVLALHNFSREPQEITLRIDGEDGGLLVSLLDFDDSRAGKSGKHRISLPAYGYRWYRVGGLNYVRPRPSRRVAQRVS